MVSNMGRVYSKIRIKPNTKNYFCGGIICSNTQTKRGYVVVKLRYQTKWKMCKIHRLVAEAFLHKEVGLDIINHKDGNKTNNHVNNIEWCNQLHNNLHALRTGLRVNVSGEKSGRCFYSDKLILETIDLHNSGFDVRHISIKTGIPDPHIRKIIKRQTREYLTKDVFIRLVDD